MASTESYKLPVEVQGKRRAYATEKLGSGISEEAVNLLGGWARGSNVARTIYQQPQNCAPRFARVLAERTQ